MENSFTTSMMIEVELKFDIEFTVNPGQRLIVNPPDRAQEGIPAHIEDVEFHLPGREIEKLLNEMYFDPEAFIDFDWLMGEAASMVSD